MNLKYLMTLIILNGILFSESYNIIGVVLDLDTQKPIDNGIIFIKEYEQGTMTDSDGYFQLIINNK